MKKQDNLARLIAIGAIYLIIAAVYVVRLLYLQVSGQDYYTMSTPTAEYTRTVKIQAQRGEIYDRNGVPLVTNDYSYNLCLDYDSKPSSSAELNEMLLDIHTIAVRSGETDKLTVPKSSLEIKETGSGLEFSYPENFENTTRGKRYRKLVGELNIDEDASPQEEAEALMYYFGIRSREYVDEEYEYYYNYTYSLAAELFVLRLDMELSGFSSVQPYVLAEDISLEFITGAEELIPRGITVSVSASRVYNYPGYLSHVLGTIGKIQKNVEYYTEKGYPLDAIVGREGIEAAFEDYLRGQDGVLTITEDAYGNIISTEVTTEPIAGNDVYLTIDIEMQMVAEKALAENIFKIREEAAQSGKPLTGEDASSGAMTVLDCDTGEVLTIASYPTFNLATYGTDFNYLRDDETSPLLNRALNGTFAPGSTFKVGVAVAALSEGVIEKDTIIETEGMYMYYAASNFTPRCWLYLMSGGTRWHGPISVVEAIQESCNCFFYDVGRQLTIEKMNEYCRLYGLGGPTGIELPESVGILAGPDYRNDNGLDKWSPGDTIQAAIGQSDNQFTPLQISSYIATILNGGTRYNCHILSEVRKFGTNETVYKKMPEEASSFDLDPDILATVKEGMKGVMDNGSAASVFSGYEISVGGKTGTAQVSEKKSDNGIMTAFAPFEDPEIVVTCVIEQGSGGTNAGYSVRDVFDYYFKVDEIRAAAAAEKAAEEAAQTEEGEDINA